MQKKHKTKHDEYLDDVALWESKQLGADPKYARRVSVAEDKALDDSLGLQAISIRLQKDLLEQLKALAKEEGLGYQPFIRQILTKYAKQASRTRKKEST
jgi:uncharacterized protein (DUF4415 family)